MARVPTSVLTRPADRLTGTGPWLYRVLRRGGTP